MSQLLLRMYPVRGYEVTSNSFVLFLRTTIVLDHVVVSDRVNHDQGTAPGSDDSLTIAGPIDLLYRNNTTGEFNPEFAEHLTEFLVNAGWPGARSDVFDLATNIANAWKLTPKDMGLEVDFGDDLESITEARRIR